MATSKPTVYEIVTQRILDALDAGTVPWHKPWAGGEPKNFHSGKAYRGINVFMLNAAGYSSPYWLTFKQAKERGGCVRKGEKGHPVVFWKWLERDQVDDTTGKTTKRHIPLLRYYTVFNADQVDGIEFPEPGHGEGFNPIAECETVYPGYPSPPSLRHGEPQAYYRPATDTVNMPQPELFDGAAEYYSTLFHELTHSTGHESRTNRHNDCGADHHFGSKSYAQEELVAEMGAAFLCGHCGIENKTIDNSAAYIESWRRKLSKDSNLIVMAAAQAQKAIDHILNRKFEDR